MGFFEGLTKGFGQSFNKSAQKTTTNKQKQKQASNGSSEIRNGAPTISASGKSGRSQVSSNDAADEYSGVDNSEW